MPSTNLTRTPPLAADLLLDLLLQRRWFRSKAREVRGSRIRDTIAIPGTDSSIILLDVEFEQGDTDTYLLTVQNNEYDALGNPKFTAALLGAIADEKSFQGEHGRITACHTPAFQRILGSNHADLPAKVSKAEQTNSSVLYGDRFILKLFRKIEPGVNPDFEIGRFLTEHGFQHTPALAGHIEYRTSNAEPMSVGILQEFVPNRGDAWEYTLQAAGNFFDSEAETIGDYLESARLLGERTAQMHIAFASGGGPDFEPEPFTQEFRDQLYKQLQAQADTTIVLIRDKRDSEDANRLLELEPRIREKFRLVRENPIHAVRIRHHGDYHLGQVLYTGDDFVIIDFEGEPARPLEERRMKRSAMRDVAGMIRSFQYAAYSAFGKREAEQRAAFWTASASRAFLDAYFRKADGHPFLPPDPAERKLLLDVFLLEKALYEVAYELNNRPDWVGIPLRGIIALME